ncbi:hypothetical protein [Apilactobacillus xinyiensis]|uniref:hypothetical protein n=1 Tax=Apilactobacillus xinyiensis TaxID=2841032 RepID=UPI00200DDEE5|nr:hypothetical protein [Apilactobacillus xinyiensis]MCL0330649.1 hypothetical protein [Apilactobacillus xinyiensis]
MLQIIFTAAVLALILLFFIAYIKNIIVQGMNECTLYKYQTKLDYFKETQKLTTQGEDKNE